MPAMLPLKTAAACRFDAVALGEVMLRLDPGPGRVRTARVFRVWEGGGEYNVVRGLRRCFGLRTALVTAIPDSEVGRLLEDLLLEGGVDLSHVDWVPYDGVGRTARVGLNFTERGFGVRAGSGTYDRGHTAASRMKPGDGDWDGIFRREGARWFHTGGIFAALSPTTPEVIREAMRSARRNRTVVSYDLNTRSSLWKSGDPGGMDRAVRVNRSLVALADVLVGNEGDFESALGVRVKGVPGRNGGDRRSPQLRFASFAGAGSGLSAAHFTRLAKETVRQFPNLKAVAATMRRAKSATRNDWGAALYMGRRTFTAVKRPGMEVFDRVGGGDGFASGLIYGLLSGQSPRRAVNLGAAHGALVMTTPGDVSMATLAEVERVVKGSDARMER